MPGFWWNSALNGEMISRFGIWGASLNKTHLVISSIPIFFVDFLLTQHIRTCQQRSQHQNFSAAVRSDQPGSLETWGTSRAGREMGMSQNRGTRYPKSSKALTYSIENNIKRVIPKSKSKFLITNRNIGPCTCIFCICSRWFHPVMTTLLGASSTADTAASRSSASLWEPAPISGVWIYTTNQLGNSNMGHQRSSKI